MEVDGTFSKSETAGASRAGGFWAADGQPQHTTIMRLPVIMLALLATTACSRQVVLANPNSSEAPAVKVTNRAPQAVTVYVTPAGGQELSVGVVQSNSTEVLVVSGVAIGAVARLRAALADGSRSYSRDNVSLTRMYDWTVP